MTKIPIRKESEQPRRRPWLGIMFECCNVYVQISRSKDGDAYVGMCPRCGKSVRVPIGPGGSSSRIFRAR